MISSYIALIVRLLLKYYNKFIHCTSQNSDKNENYGDGQLVRNGVVIFYVLS